MSKIKLAGIGITFIGLIIFGHAEVFGADWKVFDEEMCKFAKTDPNFKGKFKYKRLYYYDPESISKPSKGTVTVWTRFVEQKETLTRCELGKYQEEIFQKKIKYIEERMPDSSLSFSESDRITAEEVKGGMWDPFPCIFREYALKYKITLYRFNCLERTYRELETHNYDKEGNDIGFLCTDDSWTSLTDEEWKKLPPRLRRSEQIEPESRIEKLYKKVCR